MSEAEQIAKVRHVLTFREDYYQMLCVPRTATEAEIKTAYRRASLLVHPDRCKHEKATEAFKHLGLANSTLQDEQKRKTYDRYGVKGVMEAESGQRPGADAAARGGGMRAGGQHFHFAGGRGADTEMFEELFSMFMNPNDRMRRAQRQHQQGHYQQQQQQRGARPAEAHYEFNGNPLLAFLPFILFFIFAILLQSGSFMGDGQASAASPWGATRREQQEKAWKRSLFSLSRTSEHYSERVTTQLPDELSHLQVPYFVARGFEQALARNNVRLRAVEMEVLGAKKESLERRCSADVKRGVQQARSTACAELGKYHSVRT